MRRKPKNLLEPPKVSVRPIVFGTLPRTARLLYSALRSGCPPPLFFSVPELPINSNDQLRRGRVVGTGAPIMYLRKEVDEWRRLVLEAIVKRGDEWRPRGVTCAILVLESPRWLTKERRPRAMDCDNRYKSFGDAVEAATLVQDHTTWEIHVYKLASTRTRAVGILFDLGCEVEQSLEPVPYLQKTLTRRPP